MFLRSRPALLLLTSLAVAAAAAPAASAADPATQSPEAILSDLARDLQQVKSFRYTGTVTEPRLKSRLLGDSTNAGRSRLTLTQGREVTRMILFPSRMYLSFNRGFLQANATKKSVKRYTNRWLKFSGRDSQYLSSGIAEISPQRLATCTVYAAGTLSHGGTATVGGQPAVVVVDQGDVPGSTPRTLYVAASGPVLPLRIVQTGKRRPGGKLDTRCRGEDDETTHSDLRFTRFDQTLKIAAPKKIVKGPIRLK